MLKNKRLTAKKVTRVHAAVCFVLFCEVVGGPSGGVGGRFFVCTGSGSGLPLFLLALKNIAAITKTTSRTPSYVDEYDDQRYSVYHISKDVLGNTYDCMLTC